MVDNKFTKVSPHDFDTKKFSIRTAESHRFQLHRSKAVVVEMDDRNFHFGSSVFLPVPHSLESHDLGQIGGLRIIARAMRHILDESHMLLLAGHTDSVGSDDANLKLSHARSSNVLLFLQGNYDGWACACEDHKVEDYQCILNWVADTWGWACDPGDVDGKDGPKTRAALKGFRKAYQTAFEQELSSGHKPTRDDWIAFADLYERAIVEHVDVVGGRDNLTLADPPILACGEHWPENGTYKDNVRSAENRRVELLFFADSNLPDFTASDPPGYMLYGTDRFFVREYLDVEPEHRFYFSI